MKRPTQAALAVRLGVSQFTVSLALRNDPRLPVATRERIRSFAERAGYRPDPLVSALMARVRRGGAAGARGSLACVLVRPGRGRLAEHPSLQRALAGARGRARQLGFGWEEFWLEDEPLPAARLDGILRARGLHGVILHPGEDGEARAVPELPWERHAAAVLALLDPRLAGFHTASLAPFRHVQLALQKAVAAGARSVGLALEARYDRMVEHLYTGALSVAGEWFPGLRVVPGHLPEALGRSAFLHWWKRHHPEVVLTRSVEPLSWLRSVRGGGRVSCLHLGWHPGLGADWAGVDPCTEAVGAACADLVVEQLMANERGLPGHPKVVLINGLWREGASLRLHVSPGVARGAV